MLKEFPLIHTNEKNAHPHKDGGIIICELQHGSLQQNPFVTGMAAVYLLSYPLIQGAQFRHCSQHGASSRGIDPVRSLHCQIPSSFVGREPATNVSIGKQHFLSSQQHHGQFQDFFEKIVGISNATFTSKLNTAKSFEDQRCNRLNNSSSCGVSKMLQKELKPHKIS